MAKKQVKIANRGYLIGSGFPARYQANKYQPKNFSVDWEAFSKLTEEEKLALIK